MEVDEGWRTCRRKNDMFEWNHDVDSPRKRQISVQDNRSPETPSPPNTTAVCFRPTRRTCISANVLAKNLVMKRFPGFWLWYILEMMFNLVDMSCPPNIRRGDALGWKTQKFQLVFQFCFKTMRDFTGEIKQWIDGRRRCKHEKWMNDRHNLHPKLFKRSPSWENKSVVVKGESCHALNSFYYRDSAQTTLLP